MMIIKSIAAAVRAVISIMVFYLLMLYVFAIFFFTVFGPRGVIPMTKHYRTLGDTMITLAFKGTFMDDVGEHFILLVEASPYMAVTFVLFIILTAMTLFNMLIGILTEVLIATSESQKEDNDIDIMKKELATRPEFADEAITREELHEILLDDSIWNIFDRLGIDASHLNSVCDVLFEDSSTGSYVDSVTVPRLFEFFLQLRETKTARIIDILDLHKVLAEKHASAEANQKAMNNFILQIAHKLDYLSRQLLHDGQVSDQDLEAGRSQNFKPFSPRTCEMDERMDPHVSGPLPSLLTPEGRVERITCA